LPTAHTLIFLSLPPVANTPPDFRPNTTQFTGSACAINSSKPRCQKEEQQVATGPVRTKLEYRRRHVVVQGNIFLKVFGGQAFQCPAPSPSRAPAHRDMASPRVLSIQSHVVSGYVGNKAATFPLQVRLVPALRRPYASLRPASRRDHPPLPCSHQPGSSSDSTWIPSTLCTFPITPVSTVNLWRQTAQYTPQAIPRLRASASRPTSCSKSSMRWRKTIS
jgi:hypothetical protein